MPIPLGVLAVAGAGAAGGGNSFDLLESTILSSNAASVTFSNLNNYSDYKHLQLRITMKDSWTSQSVTVSSLRFNNVSSFNNYAMHWLYGNGSSVSAYSTFNSNRIDFGGAVTSASGLTNMFGAAVIDILDFGSTSKQKTVRAFSGGMASSSGEVGIYSGLFNSTNAITSIQLVAGVVNFVAGSRFSLYGIK